MIKKFLYRACTSVAATFLLVGWVQCRSSQAVHLKSVYHHTGSTIGSARLELGTLVLFFSSSVTPVLLSKKTLRDGNQEYVYLFAHAQLFDAQTNELLNKANSVVVDGYSVRLDTIKSPAAGLRLTLQFNPLTVAFVYDTLVSRSALPGYVFRFINKVVQQEISAKVNQKGVIKTTLHTKKKVRVVIDPGHGGNDPGAIGVTRLQEKDITLILSKRVSRLLRSAGCEAVLTRATDCSLALQERSACTNAVGADLFISIHANSALNNAAFGIETFYYPHAWSKTLFSSGLEMAFVRNYLSSKQLKATLLAHEIQDNLCLAVSGIHTHKKSINRSVKTAPFQVLIGPHAPAVLVEVGFLSHAYEEQLLRMPRYQDLVARGIVRGILSYIKKSSSTT